MDTWSTVDELTRIVVFAGPGHYRDSLIALLRTIPRADLVLSDKDLLSKPDSSYKSNTSVVLVDLASPGNVTTDHLTSIRSNWPGARFIILADNLQQTRLAHRLGADCILPRNVSAGDFLMAIRELNLANPRSLGVQTTLCTPDNPSFQLPVKTRQPLQLSMSADRPVSGLSGR